MYEISILPEPEIINGKLMYFWSIMGRSGENRFNCGHGWSESILRAAVDADEYYRNALKKEL